jgi:hypothetical protein
MRCSPLVMAATLGLSACAGKVEGPQFSAVDKAPADKSLIYFLRPTDERFGLSIRKIYVSVDGKSVGTMPQGGYFKRQIEPGRHIVTADTSSYIAPPLIGALVEAMTKEPSVLSLTTNPAEAVSVKLHAADQGLYIGAEVTLLPASEELAQIKNTNLVE